LAVIDRITPRFARYEPLRHAAELMAGMVSGLDRKNCWTIAVRREVAVRHEALMNRGRWESRGGREAALTKPGRLDTARQAGSGEQDQTVYERNQ
jgi:hypothetical protein